MQKPDHDKIVEDWHAETERIRRFLPYRLFAYRALGAVTKLGALELAARGIVTREMFAIAATSMAAVYLYKSGDEAKCYIRDYRHKNVALSGDISGIGVAGGGIAAGVDSEVPEAVG